MRVRVEFFALLALMQMFAGCAGSTFAPDAAPEYLVVRDKTPLYRYGPQQGGAPENWLRKDERVRMLRHEFGFSFVQSGDTQTGYVANEDLAIAPPLPRPVAVESSIEHGPVMPFPVVEDPPLPRPDLDQAPADAPASDR